MNKELKEVKKEKRIEKEICPYCHSDKLIKSGTCGYCIECGETNGCS